MAEVEQKSPRKLSGKGVVLPAAAANNMICKACSKRVYELEKLVMGDVIYHKTCFRCQTCNSVLKLNNFGAANGKNFCKPHFIEAFKVKGNYSAGFADNDEEEKAKTKKTSDVKPPADKLANGSNGVKANGNGNLHADEPAPVPTSVSRAEDTNELPAEGTTRQRLALLKQLTEDRQDPAPRTKTSPTEETAPVNVTRNMLKKFESLNASGDAKNQTAASVAEDDRELPAADTTRNLLAKFRSMEDPSRAPPSPQTTTEHHHKTTAVDVMHNVKEEEAAAAPSDHDAAAHTHHTVNAAIEDADADDSFLQVKDDGSDRGDADVVGEEVGGSEEWELVNDRHEVDEEVEERHSAGEVHHEMHHEYEHHDAAHHSHEVHHHDNGHEAHDDGEKDDVANEAEERIRHHDDSDNEVDATHREGEGRAENDDM